MNLMFAFFLSIAPWFAEGWETAWSLFYAPQTHLFYDYISSYEIGKSLDHLPTLEEMSVEYPNPCGYSTGMEDCAILNGTMLGALTDAYEKNSRKEWKQKAEDLLKGCSLLATQSDAYGYVLRGVSPRDGHSHYTNTSRDQVTHWAWGLWKYYHGKISTAKGRQTVRKLLRAVADRMHRVVIPANDYDMLRSNGLRSTYGNCKMWEVQPHEAARLPMLYAVAFDVTGDEIYAAYRDEYLAEAIDCSEKIVEDYPSYVYLQMMYAFTVLQATTLNSSYQNRLQRLRERVVLLAAKKAAANVALLKQYSASELEMLGPDWRKVEVWNMQGGFPNPYWGAYRVIWNRLRAAGEYACVAALSDDMELHLVGRRIWQAAIADVNWTRTSCCGIVFHLATAMTLAG